MDENGLTIKNWMRTLMIPWTDVESIELGKGVYEELDVKLKEPLRLRKGDFMVMFGATQLSDTECISIWSDFWYAKDVIAIHDACLRFWDRSESH